MRSNTSCAPSACAPFSSNSFRCFDDPVFDERKGETALRRVQDPRITAAVAAHLNDPANGVKFFGHSVSLDTPGRVASGMVNNTGWQNRGRADDALIIEVNGWDTQQLTSWVATILLKERVGYNVAHIQNPGSGGTFGRMAPTETRQPVHANFEVWPNSKIVQYTKWKATTHNAGILGAFGRDGLYTTTKFKDAMEQKNIFLEYWRSLAVPDVLAELTYSPSPIFNASLLGSCFTDETSPAAGAEACTTCKAGTVHQCVNGTFVTPSCAANGGPTSGKCGILTMIDPGYSPGMLPQITSNLNLSYQLPFVGYSAALRHVLDREKHGEPVLFYHWQPGALSKRRLLLLFAPALAAVAAAAAMLCYTLPHPPHVCTFACCLRSLPRAKSGQVRACHAS